MLVPVSILLLAGAIWAFVWAVRSGQFDDLDTPPLDILHDEDRDAPRTPAVEPGPEPDAVATALTPARGARTNTDSARGPDAD